MSHQLQLSICHSRSLTCALFQFLPCSSVTTVTSLSPLLPPPTQPNVCVSKNWRNYPLYFLGHHAISPSIFWNKSTFLVISSPHFLQVSTSSLCNKSESLNTQPNLSEYSFETLNSSSRFLFFTFSWLRNFYFWVIWCFWLEVFPSLFSDLRRWVPMAAGTMATAAGAAVLLYYVLSRRLASSSSAPKVDDEDGGDRRSSGGELSRSSRKRIARRPAQAPATLFESITTLSETLRFTYSETLGKWPIGDLAFGINYFMRRQVCS